MAELCSGRYDAQRSNQLWKSCISPAYQNLCEIQVRWLSNIPSKELVFVRSWERAIFEQANTMKTVDFHECPD